MRLVVSLGITCTIILICSQLPSSVFLTIKVKLSSSNLGLSQSPRRPDIADHCLILMTRQHMTNSHLDRRLPFEVLSPLCRVCAGLSHSNTSSSVDLCREALNSTNLRSCTCMIQNNFSSTFRRQERMRGGSRYYNYSNELIVYLF